MPNVIHQTYKLSTPVSFLSAAFPLQTIILSAVGNLSTAGDMFRLDCNISRAKTLLPSTLLEVIWLDNINNSLISNSNTSITGDTSSTASNLYSQLTFSRVRTSQGGRYSCVVNMTVPGVVTDYSVIKTWTVMVMSKCACSLLIKQGCLML